MIKNISCYTDQPCGKHIYPKYCHFYLFHTYFRISLIIKYQLLNNTKIFDQIFVAAWPTELYYLVFNRTYNLGFAELAAFENP